MLARVSKVSIVNPLKVIHTALIDASFWHSTVAVSRYHDSHHMSVHISREFQGSTLGCPGLDPHPYPHDTPTPTPQGGGHSHGCQGADLSGVDPRVWHLPLDHTVQVYNIFIIIYYTR